MENDDVVFSRWYNNTLGRSPATGTCEDSCKYRALCNIRETTFIGYNRCLDEEPDI